MNEWQAESISTITQHYPFDRQRDILVEKCAEVTASTQRLKIGGSNIANYNSFVKALAELSVMADELIAYMNPSTIEQARTRFLDNQLIQISREAERSEHG